MAFVASTSSQSSSTLLKPLTSHSPIPAQSFFSSKPLSAFSASISSSKTSLRRRLSHPINCSLKKNPISISSLVGAAGVAVALVASTASGSSLAAELSSLGSSLQFSEPQNALSLPTWAIHVSSVAEWITAMVLVWQYGERPGCESWKGLSWGMEARTFRLGLWLLRTLKHIFPIFIGYPFLAELFVRAHGISSITPSLSIWVRRIWMYFTGLIGVCWVMPMEEVFRGWMTPSHLTSKGKKIIKAYCEIVFKKDEIGMEIFHIVLPAAMALAADPISFLIDTTFIGHVLVALQAALTVIGNFTMCIAAFRIFKSTQGGSENL